MSIVKDRCGFLEDAALAIPDDRSIVRVFYGPGGQGKTALCRELFRRTGGDIDPAYKFLKRVELDLHGRPTTDPDLLLVWIRNGFAKAGVAFPTFDLALALAWEASRGEQEFPKLENAWLARSADMLTGVASDAVEAVRETVEKSVETIPGLGVLITRGSKWVIDKTRRAYLERTRESLNELYCGGELKKPYELSELLPWMLAQDLNHHLKGHPKERFVLFIDEYERVFEEGGAGARWRENPFDQHLRTLVRETNGLLAVFFSREMLPWSDDPAWRDDLADAHYPLAGLADADADEWLLKIPLEEADIRLAIINGSREELREDAPVYTLMLELQVEHWRGLTASTIDITPSIFHVAAETFEGRCLELVQRVLRDYGDELQVTLERLSVANRFDRMAFEHVVSIFGTGLPLDAFDRIAGLSFVSVGEDGFLTMHRVIAEAIRSTLLEDTYKSTVTAMLDHFESRAKPDSARDVSDDTITALIEAAYLRREIGLDDCVEWLGEFTAPISTAARYGIAELIWRQTLQAVEDKFGQEHPDTASSYNNVAYNLNAQGRYEDAEPLYREGLEIRERVLGEEHPTTKTIRSNLSHCLAQRGSRD